MRRPFVVREQDRVTPSESPPLPEALAAEDRLQAVLQVGCNECTVEREGCLPGNSSKHPRVYQAPKNLRHHERRGSPGSSPGVSVPGSPPEAVSEAVF